jgi:UDP-N-acetylmuramoylalanine-D-glutamate ligase
LLIYYRYFKPQLGVITNIGVDHLDQCKTVENYIKAKSKLLDGLGNKGIFILNLDDENTFVLIKTSMLDSYGSLISKLKVEYLRNELRHFYPPLYNIDYSEV